MRKYELMVIFDKDAKEDERQAILDGFTNGVKECGGEVTLKDVWGLRPFAYEIDHKFEGYYVVQEFTAQGDLAELERPMRLSDAVVRQKIMLIPIEEIERRNGLRAIGASTYAIPRANKRGKHDRDRGKSEELVGAKVAAAPEVAEVASEAVVEEAPITAIPEMPKEAPEAVVEEAPITAIPEMPKEAPEVAVVKEALADETPSEKAPEEVAETAPETAESVEKTE